MRDCVAPFLHDIGECGCEPGYACDHELPLQMPAKMAPGAVCPRSDRGRDEHQPYADRADRDAEPGRSAHDDRGEPDEHDQGDQHGEVDAPAERAIPVTSAGWTWSEYEHELRLRGARAADPAEHGMWCPPDCACGWSLPEDVAEHNPLLGAARAMLDPQHAAMFLAADDADRMLHGDGAFYRFLLGGWREIEPGSKYEDGELVRAICDHVQTQLEEWAIDAGLDPAPPGWDVGQGVDQRAKNLLIRIPPRSLKTVIVTIAATAWAWLRWPTMTIMSFSANPRVTADASDRVRSLIRSEWYQTTFRPTWRIREDKDALAHLQNTAGGWRKARGITSKVTGEGADWRVIDDPHDGTDVFSKAKREEVHARWEGSHTNRWRDPRVSICTGIMQALHWDDWGERRIREGWGLLLVRMCYTPSWAGGKPKEYPPKVVVQPDDLRVSPYGWVDWRTEADEPVAIRWTPSVLAPLREKAITWSAQYQQDPAPLDGGIIKESDLCSYAELPSGLESWAITVDAAFKKNEGVKGSRVSVQVWARKGPARFLVDNETKGMDLNETIECIMRMREKWPRAKHAVLVEEKANGVEIVHQLRLKIPGVVAVKAGAQEGDKTARLMACQSFFVGKCVYLPEYAPWLESYKQELCQFPNWPKNDQVDATVQLLLYWQLNTAAARARGACSL